MQGIQRMQSEVLETLTKQIHTRWMTMAKHVWIRGTATDDDIDAIKEAGKESRFDPLRLRSGLLEDVKKGKAHLVSRHLVNKSTGKCFASVHLILPVTVQPKDAIPWALWEKILLLFGRSQKPWRILIFGSLSKRERPTHNQPLGPSHLNGGYAYPGDPRSVVLYRLEEATRVLVHELLHACGSDDMSLSESEREVRTESWAELFLIAVLAKGMVSFANRMWKQQAQWIRDQEEIVALAHGVKGEGDYAWRYISGRRAYLESFGMTFPLPSTPLTGLIGNSSRFTNPALCF